MKQDTTDTAFAYLTGGIFSVVAYLVGGVDELTTALAILMVTDYGMGLSIALFITENATSKRAYRGLAKKSGMIAFVIVCNQIDIIVGSDNHFLRNAMIMCLIGTEGLSIVENAGKMGIKPPQIVVNMFKNFNGSDNGPKGENNDGDQR